MSRLIRMAFLTMIVMIFGAAVSFAGSGTIGIKLDGVDIVSDTPPVIENGSTLAPVRAVFEAMGGTVGWNEASREVTLNSRDTEIRLAIGSGNAYINGAKKAMDVPARIINGRTMIPVRFVSEALGCKVSWNEKNRIVSIVSSDTAAITSPSETAVKDPKDNADTYVGDAQSILDQYGLSPVKVDVRDKLVVIDPGHGGTDTGSRGYENGVAVLNEKDINLDIALRVQKMLEAAGARIYMIRTTDVTVPLYDRQDIANAMGASLYVSIHNNSYPSPSPSGTEVHYHGQNDPPLKGISAMELALNLQRTLIANLGTYDRGPKVSPQLAVLRRTIMPAVIIEGAFISNPNDLRYMKTDDFREKYALSVAKCVIEALNKSDKDIFSDVYAAAE